MKKLCAVASLLLAVIILVGCSIMENAKRQEFEERFSRISEVYPTTKVEELFKKFPKGFEIEYLKTEYTGDSPYTQILKFDGDAKTKEILGTYVKESYEEEFPHLSVESEPIQIKYTDEKGIESTDGQELPASVRNIRFLFTNFSFDKEKLKDLTYLNVTESPVDGNYSIRYEIVNQTINDYIGINSNDKIEMELFGVPKFDKAHKYSVTIAFFKRGRDYFSEAIKEK
ncbi:hypothetical protein STRDD11_01191 [Streptococcus sp. DD11]|uniref:Csa1 family protein n=1 Tax=Streptococcus sp. DD11 TaxID=1777879 RepID=UPI000792C3D0|nr:Csa1 family protein [Streptococcus sp. DD11]KXT83986.1 hypothetical protein STRDD11_01191 [Streptococcus sp. DD11]